MKTNWSLDAIYKGFDAPEFLKDWAALPKKIEEINDFAVQQLTPGDSTDEAAKKIKHYLTLQLELSQLGGLSSFISLTLSTDSTNSEALKLSDRLSSEYANLSLGNTLIAQYIGAREDLEEIIQSSEQLTEHAFVLHEIAQQSHHTASEQEEQLLAKLQTTGSDAWGNQYELLTSTLMVDIDLEGQPEQMTLSAVRNLAYHPDQNTRKTAYEAELNAYEKIDKSVGASINAIKGEAIITADLRNYDDVLDMTLQESRMDRETLDAMWEAIVESLPDFEQYFQRKAQLLGHENGLPFYDLFAPIGGDDSSLPYEEAADQVVKNLSRFNPAMGAYARHAFDNQWIDVYPKEGKRGGAFCHTIKSIDQARIMTNYSDSFEGALTLAHELGHAYHSHCLESETALNSRYPMPIAETASTFNEILMVRAALETATPEESISIIESYLTGLTQVTMDIYSRYLFETHLISRRKEEGPLSVDELNSVMLEAQKEAYGHGLDHQVLHPYMWLCKPHYYSAGRNFYNFPYAYGQLFALGLYSLYEKEGDAFLPKYDAILKATGRNSLWDIGQLADIDVRDKAFWKRSLAIAAQDVETFLTLTDPLV